MLGLEKEPELRFAPVIALPGTPPGAANHRWSGVFLGVVDVDLVTLRLELVVQYAGEFTADPPGVRDLAHPNLLDGWGVGVLAESETGRTPRVLLAAAVEHRLGRDLGDTRHLCRRVLRSVSRNGRCLGNSYCDHCDQRNPLSNHISS